MSRNVVPRSALRAGVVECPLCERQLVAPEDHLLAFGPTAATVDAADAVECPVCEGVSFVVDPAADDGSETDDG